jgi:hypothetical protein
MRHAQADAESIIGEGVELVGGHESGKNKSGERNRIKPSRPRKLNDKLFRELNGFAAALAFARVFAFAAHIARLAAALAFATVEAFAVMFCGAVVGGA